MIANYVNDQHDTWDQFLREFAYAICTAVNKTTGKTPAELFLGRTLITPFQKLVMVSDGTEFAVAKFKPKFEDPYRIVEVKNNNVVIWKAGKRLTINVNQVRLYRHRKCGEMEIRTGSSDNNSSRDESSNFDRVKRRSNESQSTPSSWSETSRKIKKSKKENIGYKRSRESGLGGPNRKIQKGSEHRVHKRALLSKYTNSVLPKYRKRDRTEETVTPTTRLYNLRPRSGKRVESRPTFEMKTQQGGPVRARKSKGRNYNPYIEEKTRSGNKNTRRRGNKQQKDQERKGEANTSRTISLEVLVGDANYKS
ncbi:uncharacterized protein TNCV_4780411 [Trichonephila clavipes]|nr:uncharacterized protein TNCV_4780411 [Trichonephila clavipes]